MLPTVAQADPKGEITVFLSSTSVAHGEKVTVTHGWNEENGNEISWYSYRILPIGFFHRARGQLVAMKRSGSCPIRLEGLEGAIGGVHLDPIEFTGTVGTHNHFVASVVGMFLISVEYTTSGEDHATLKSPPVLLTVEPPRRDGKVDEAFRRSKKILVDPDLHNVYERAYDSPFATE
jgi:hypothetical protein